MQRNDKQEVTDVYDSVFVPYYIARALEDQSQLGIADKLKTAAETCNKDRHMVMLEVIRKRNDQAKFELDYHIEQP